MAGRPKIPIDWDKVDKYLISGSDGAAIAGFLNIKARWLYVAVKRDKHMYFTDYMMMKRSIGVLEIENKLFESAKDGNIIAMIFYLKNKAGWSDNQHITHEGLPPAINVTIGAKVDDETVTKLNEYFNGTTTDKGISGELESVPRRLEAHHQLGRPGKLKNP